MQLQKDEFNPEWAEKFAQLLGKVVSRRAEVTYRLGIAFRESNPALSNIFMLGFICLAGNDISAKFK